MRIKHHFNQLTIFAKKNRRALIIIGLILLLVTIALMSFLSFKNWDNYKKNYTQFFSSAQKNLDSEIDKIIKNTGDSMSEKLIKIINLKNQLTDENAAICKTGDVYDWQKIIGSINNEIENCKKEKDNLSDRLELIKTTTTYLEYEHKLSDIISLANSQTDKNNSTEKWHLIEAIWRQAAIDADKPKVSKEFDSIKKSSVDYLNIIAEAWKALSQANKDEDRQKFEKAKEDLTVVYSSLSNLSKSSAKQLNDLIVEF